MGIALAVAILIVGLSFMDVMNVLIDEQFGLLMRQDATVTFAEPKSPDAVYDLAHLPGVIDVEPQRSVAVRLRHGTRARTLAITGMVAEPRLARVVDRSGRTAVLPPDGLLLSAMLANRLGVRAGDSVRVEVLEGRRPVRDVTVAGLVDDSVGLQANMRLDALHRLLREGADVTGAAVTVDHAQLDRFYAELKRTPVVAGVALRDVALKNFRETMAESMYISILFNVMFATVIAFGVVYNAARVSLSERSRELASLRVLGFTRAEISLILLGELAIVTVCALPVGTLIGYGLGHVIMRTFNNEVYRLSFVVGRSTVAWSFLVVIASALLSGLVVRHRIDHLDLVAVLKTPE
jgi:putative ABC transport system permease protein